MPCLYQKEGGIIEVNSDSELFFSIAKGYLAQMLENPLANRANSCEFAEEYGGLLQERGYIFIFLSIQTGTSTYTEEDVFFSFCGKLSRWYSSAVMRIDGSLAIFAEVDLKGAVDGPQYPASMQMIVQRIQQCQRELLAELGVRLRTVTSSINKGLLRISEQYQQVLFSISHVLSLYSQLDVITALTPLKQIPDTSALRTKPDLERMYFDAILNHDFSFARNIVKNIITDQSSTPATALSIRIRVDCRLAWTATLLGIPRNESLRECVAIYRCQERIVKSKTIGHLLDNVDTFFLLLEKYYRQAPARLGDKIESISKYVRENCTQTDLSLYSICDEFGTSPSHLSHTFTEKTGINLLNYIHLCRIDRAKELLGSTDLKLSEIAAQVGYSGDWALIRSFKKYIGMTPGQYRSICNNA